MKKLTLLLLALTAALYHPRAVAQEADHGIDLRATLSAQAVASSALTQSPRYGSPVAAGFRAVLYPTSKFGEHWSATAALQLYSHPYFYESFETAGYGVKGTVLQASLNYARVSDKGSLLLRAGVLSTAFGSFPLHYDDVDNPVVDTPIQYGYYSVTSDLGLLSAQVDATRGRWDGRAQFANSSPANPRSIFAPDQYGNWAGGGGYTIRQGLRVGVSGYRGPYLDRKYPYFFPGEANPNTLPAHALGVDVQWTHGHLNIQGEFQKFVMPYKTIPTFREEAGYVEVKRALSPRWYIAGRGGYTSANASGNIERFEVAGGFRPNRFQLLKMDYELEHSSGEQYHFEKTFGFQFITTLHR